jgi:hypothetical protein
MVSLVTGFPKMMFRQWPVLIVTNTLWLYWLETKDFARQATHDGRAPERVVTGKNKEFILLAPPHNQRNKDPLRTLGNSENKVLCYLC